MEKIKNKKLVILESPFAGDIEKNLEYARKCMRDCFERGEFPFASHLLYTQHGILDDANSEERKLGIEAGLEWGKFAKKTVVYADLGISKGMNQGVEKAKKDGRVVEYRSFGVIKKKLLFVCSGGIDRSPCAAELVNEKDFCEARSCGVGGLTDVEINLEMVEWADEIVCMEKWHRDEVMVRFAKEVSGMRVYVLGISNDYLRYDKELVGVLEMSLERVLSFRWK